MACVAGRPRPGDLIASDGIYFGGPEQRRAAIKFYDFRSPKVKTVAYWEKQPFAGAPGMGIFPDGKWILYVQLDEARNNWRKISADSVSSCKPQYFL